jgi:hypothetical protein
MRKVLVACLNIQSAHLLNDLNKTLKEPIQKVDFLA